MLLNQLIARLGLGLHNTRGASLTHRELNLAGKQLPDATRVELVTLAATAERIRYGDELPNQEELNEAVEKGSALLRSLEAER